MRNALAGRASADAFIPCCTAGAPRLTGLALRLFVPFMESPFSFPLVAKLMSDSGIPQVCFQRQLLAKRSVLAGMY